MATTRDQNARIVISSTPRFAQMVAFKYAEFGAGRVIEDRGKSPGRAVARSCVQDVAAAVAAVALAQEEAWEYARPELEEPVAPIIIGLDGTGLLMGEEGWRQALVGRWASPTRRASGWIPSPRRPRPSPAS